MSSRFADPATMRTRSPIYHDESSKRSPPSPSNKAPPSKKLDSKSRAVSEEPPVKPHPDACADKPPSNRVIIDEAVFQQILELDDDDDHAFSQDMVGEYLDQARSTIKTMDDNFAKRELTQLGKHGHFLKGSSAALGAVQVQGICEKIQHLGNRTDPERLDVKISAEDAFARIKPLLALLKDEHAAADKSLNIILQELNP